MRKEIKMSKINSLYDYPDVTQDVQDITPEQAQYDIMLSDEMCELSKLAKKYLWCVNWQNGDAIDISLVISENKPTEKMATEVVAYETGESIKRLKELQERGDFSIEKIYKIVPTMYDEVENDNEPF